MGDIQVTDEARDGDWRGIIARKRNDRAETIERVGRKQLHAAADMAEADICNLNYQQLMQSISRGALTAEAVTIAYVNRAMEAHEKTNCLTEIMFEQAISRAQQLDVYFQEHGRLVGPLHGIPMSLKDQFDVKGFDSTLGYVGRAYSPRPDDAVLVKILVSLGAVIIAKTNIPQSIMMAETNNPLWGLTVNPNEPSFTPGGSSGGEAALLACKGSLFGWGTDIGGSIRAPSSMMGLYGLKPSHGRLPYFGVSNSTEGQNHVPSVVGPMARSLNTLTELLKEVIHTRPWDLDPNCVTLPWREEIYQEIMSRPLVIGVIWDDGVVKVHPPIQRALETLVEKLRASGHEVISWDTTGHVDIINIQDQYYTADGGEDIRRDIAACGEPFLPYVQALVDRGKPISVYQYWQLNKQKVNLQKMYLDRWNTTKSPSGRQVDVLLAPVMPHTSVPHNSVRWVGYTKVWNFLDYSALSFPVTAVSKDLDQVKLHEPRNAMDEWNWKLYDPETMHGHPVGLQVVGRRLDEESVLAAANVFENLLARETN